MVSTLSLIFMSISLIICTFLPIAVTIFVVKKYKASLKAFFIGMLAYLVAQPLLRLPFLSILSLIPWYRTFSTTSVIGYSLFLGITAGLFEETARLVGFKFMLKNKLEWKNGLVFALGHGGLEAIILGSLTYINDLSYSIMINNGTLDKLLKSSGIAQNTITQIRHQLIDSAPPIFLIGSGERIMAIVLHICMSMLVLYAVKSKQTKYYLYALLLHTLLDTPVAIMQLKGVGTLPTELYIFVLSIISIFIAIRFRRKMNNIVLEGELRGEKAK